MDDQIHKLDTTEDQAVHHAWTPDGEVAPLAATAVSEDSVIEAIATVYDPEIPVNIYELGLIYAVDIADDGKIRVEMTLTAPGCPSAQELPVMVRELGSSASSSPHSAKLRPSFHRMAGRSG